MTWIALLLACGACWRPGDPGVLVHDDLHAIASLPVSTSAPARVETTESTNITRLELKRQSSWTGTSLPRCATLPDLPDVVIEYSSDTLAVTVDGQPWTLGPLGPSGHRSAWDTAGAAPRQIGLFFWGEAGGGHALMLVVERDSTNAITCSGGYRYRGTIRY